VLCNGDFRDGLADIAVIVHDLRHVEPQCPQLTPVLMNAWSMNTTLRAELSVRSSEPHITAVLLEHGGRVSVMVSRGSAVRSRERAASPAGSC
jgi:hypothetical protein